MLESNKKKNINSIDHDNDGGVNDEQIENKKYFMQAAVNNSQTKKYKKKPNKMILIMC